MRNRGDNGGQAAEGSVAAAIGLTLKIVILRVGLPLQGPSVGCGRPNPVRLLTTVPRPGILQQRIAVARLTQ